MENKPEVAVLYCDPNAYIKRPQKKETKKVVFQEPYDCLPKYYVNNNFKRGSCNCIPKPPKPNCSPKQNCNNNLSGFNFNIKNMLPLLSSLLGKNSGELSNLVGLLGSENLSEKSGESSANFGDALNGFLSGNFDASKLMDLLKNFTSKSGGNNGGIFNFFNKKSKPKIKNETTDFEIKNYTRVN